MPSVRSNWRGPSALNTERAERVLSVGRAFLAVSGLVAIYLDPTEPQRFQQLAYGLLLTYALYSLAVLMWVRGAPALTPARVRAFHAVDVVWISGINLVSEGPVSPFFLFYMFVVLAAAYRWGFRQTLWTAAIIVAVFLAETVIAIVGPWDASLVIGDLELNRLIVRGAYLLLTGFLLGYLAEHDKQLRGELADIADAARQPRVKAGLNGSVTALGSRLVATFDAAAVAIVLHDNGNQRTLLWTIDVDEAEADGPRVRRVDLDALQRAAWLFPDPGEAWHAEAGHGGAILDARVAESGRWPLAPAPLSLPGPLLSMRRFSAITAVNLGLANEWRGRIYVFDAERAGGAERTVHFLQSLAEHIASPLTNVLLLRRLRARAGAAERARVARELHDGAIQALFGLEMKIEALRRSGQPDPAALDRELEGLQILVRHEVQELRDLMHALRPVDIDGAEQLPDVLASVVERFRRDTGISARFSAAAQQSRLPHAAAIEVVRIVQEALVNVRKHSGARNVLVRLDSEPAGGCRLVIEDDGRGFEFEGRLDAAELDHRRLGPAIIRERARMAQAGLVVESTPGAGARLELTFDGATSA